MPGFMVGAGQPQWDHYLSLIWYRVERARSVDHGRLLLHHMSNDALAPGLKGHDLEEP